MSEDMQEKFVSDDQVSAVAEPVTPAGGEVKSKKADLKKKVDPKADEVDDSEVPGQDRVEEEYTVAESIAAMFEGTDLSEEFKNKVSVVFEAAVNEAAKEKADEITENLQAEFDQTLEESVNALTEEMVDNLDGYLDYVVKEWMEENEIAVESGIKVEMAESLMDGLKELFSEHNIDIDEDTIDVVSGLEEEVSELSNKVNKTVNENIELARQIAALKSEKVFEEMTEDLTVSQTERLRSLSEKLDFDNLDSYTSNLETLKESFFKKTKATLSEDTSEEEEIITEQETKKISSEHPTVNALVEALNARNAK